MGSSQIKAALDLTNVHQAQQNEHYIAEQHIPTKLNCIKQYTKKMVHPLGKHLKIFSK